MVRAEFLGLAIYLGAFFGFMCAAVLAGYAQSEHSIRKQEREDERMEDVRRAARWAAAHRERIDAGRRTVPRRDAGQAAVVHRARTSKRPRNR